MRFAPVFLPEGRGLERRASQTLLRLYQQCPRSAFFYQRHKGMLQNMEMVRGSAFHEIVERAILLMLAQNEESIPPELLKAIVNEVLAEMAVPWCEHDYLREMAYRWAAEWTIKPAKVIACETLIVLDLGGWQVRCKVDFAQGTGLIVDVADWKTSRSAPGYEEIARKRQHDGSWVAKNFQLILYALALAYGHPVTVINDGCPVCDGSGRHPLDEGAPCRACGGLGGMREERIETGKRLAPQAEQFNLEFVYPGIENLDEKMVRRPVTLTRLELGEYYESLLSTLKGLEASERDGDWEAVLSDAACKECPSKPDCPIPRELRDHAGEINTFEDATEAAEVLDRRTGDLGALRKELKLWAKAHDVEIPFGANKAWRFVYSASERVDKDGLFQAIAAGEDVDRAQFVKLVESTNFTAVTLTDDELAEAREKEQNAGSS